METNTKDQVQTTTALSEEAKRKLTELHAQLQEQITGSQIKDYIKLKDGDHKILKFDPERTRAELVTYENQKPIPQFKFYASELLDEQQNTWTRVREWTISPKWADLVIPLLLKGFSTLEVTRTGSDKNDTTYRVTPY